MTEQVQHPDIVRSAEFLNSHVSRLGLSVRAANGLKFADIEFVWQLLQWTPEQLATCRNLGKKSVAEIVEAVRAFEFSLGARSDPEARDLPESGLHPPDKGEGEGQDDGLRMLGVFEHFKSRDRTVLWNRVLSTPARQTLEELGREFGVSRERIRQMEVKLRARLESLLEHPNQRFIRNLAETLHERVGEIAPSGDMSEAVFDLLGTTSLATSDRDLVAGLLGFAAGPYSHLGGWARRVPNAEEVTSRALMSEFDANAELSEVALGQLFDRIGIRETNRAAWMAHVGSFWKCGDAWLPVRQTLTDRVYELLRKSLTPMLISELTEESGGGSERSLRHRVLEDPRFKKISRQGYIALREWEQFPEYSAISEHIADEIRQGGGTADPGEIIAKLTRIYGVSSNSVSQYLSAPMFIKCADGRVRMRRVDEEIHISSEPRTCAGLYKNNGYWELRIEVTADTLRGSGRPVHQAVAGLVGCQPGHKILLPSLCGAIVFSWPLGSSSGSSIGSLRREVEELGGRLGDYAFIRLDGSTAAVRILAKADVEAAPAVERCALLMGMAVDAATDDNRWSSMAKSLDLSPQRKPFDAGDIHAGLMRRNEVYLANLLGDVVADAGSDIFQALETMLGL